MLERIIQLSALVKAQKLPVCLTKLLDLDAKKLHRFILYGFRLN